MKLIAAGALVMMRIGGGAYIAIKTLVSFATSCLEWDKNAPNLLLTLLPAGLLKSPRHLILRFGLCSEMGS